MNVLDIDSWSQSAVKEYLTAGTPLNDSITKIAAQHGLNKDQIARVVEAANTDTYVQLFNKTADKYIQFNPADTEKIAENTFTTKTAQVSLDYEEPPTKNELEIELSEPFVKVAEVEELPKTNNESVHEYYKLSSVEEQLRNRMEEVEIAYQSDVNILSSMIKQAVLGGTSLGDIEKALTTVYDNKVVRVNLDEIHTKLAEEVFPKKINTTITQIGTVNSENPLVKQAGALVKHADEYKQLKTKHAEARQHLVEYVKTGNLFSALTGSTARAAFAKMPHAKTPEGLNRLTALARSATRETNIARAVVGTGATAAVALPTGAAMQRKKEENAMSQQMMSQLPQQYMR